VLLNVLSVGASRKTYRDVQPRVKRNANAAARISAAKPACRCLRLILPVSGKLRPLPDWSGRRRKDEERWHEAFDRPRCS